MLANMWRIWKAKPNIVLTKAGVTTFAPIIMLRVESNAVGCLLATWADTKDNNIVAENAAKALANATCLPLVDLRAWA